VAKIKPRNLASRRMHSFPRGGRPNGFAADMGFGQRFRHVAGGRWTRGVAMTPVSFALRAAERSARVNF
jgi:hypothetical protein